MKILKESKKEQLPMSFMTSFISRGWDTVGVMKDELEAVKNSFTGTKKVADLMQDLIDAYLICIGQMEKHLADNDYISVDDAEEVKESLTEAVEEKPEEKAEEPTPEDAEATVEVLKDKLDVHGDGDTVVIAAKGDLDDEDAPKVEIPVDEDEFDALATEFHDEDDEKPEDNEDGEAEPVGEAFDYFCDFDEPVGNKPTDKDLYPED